MSNKLFFTILILLISELNIYSLSKKVSLEDAFFNFQNQASTLSEKFEEIDKLFNKREFEKSLNLALLFLEDLDNDNYVYQAKIRNLIGEIYYETHNLDLAIKYNNESLQFIDKQLSVDKFDINLQLNQKAKSHFIIGKAYQLQSLQDSLDDNLKTRLNDSVRFHYEKVEQITSFNDEILDIKAETFRNLSGLYEIDSNYTKAENYANKAIDIYIKRNNRLGRASALNSLANIYFAKNKFKKSKDIYNEAIKLIANDNSIKAIRYKANLYSNLAYAMRKLNEVEAYDRLEDANELEEKIRNDNIKKAIARVEKKYNVRSVRKEEQAKRQLQAQHFWISIAVGILVIISLVLYALFYRQRRKTLALRLANIDYEQKQKIDALKSESRNRVLSATLDGKEEERKVIAETLHDNVSALLSSANLHLQAMGKQLNGNAPAELDKTKNILNEASDKIRDLSHSLISPVLQKFGLRLSVSEIADKFSNYELDIVSNTENLKRYESNFEVKTYNIIHEFCNNIIKHSKATRAEINIEDKEGCLLIAISDNGIGFDKDIINTKDGLGIAHIEARVELMNGDITIDSVRGLGTTVNIKLPIQKKEKVDLALSKLDNF